MDFGIIVFPLVISIICIKSNNDQKRIDSGYYTIHLGKKYAHYNDSPRYL